MVEDHSIHAIASNHFLKSRNLSGADLRLYLLMVFGTPANAGKAALISDSRVSQICSGVDLPQNPDNIRRLAECWKIDLIVLNQIFENIRKEKDGD